MELSALKAFVKVVESGSFTKAAAILDTQKAHVSRQVSQLERELGVRLLERTTRSLSLTEIGRELYARSHQILESVDEARRAVQQAQSEPRGTLRLTCGTEFGMMAVSGWIQRYLRRYPLTQVQADFTSRIADLVHEGFDLAIRLGSLPDSSLNARKLGSLQYGLYAAPQYLADQGVPKHPRELARHALIAFSGGSRGFNWSLSRNGQEVRVSVASRFRVNNQFAVRDAALAGAGIAQLPALIAQSGSAANKLALVLPQWALPEVPVYAVFASARYLTPKVRAFIDEAVEAFAESLASRKTGVR